MRNGTMAVHAPALTLQEAAMLPALARETPRNLLIPFGSLDYRTGPVDAGAQPVDNRMRRGTMAGRALLAYIRSAPARRQRR